MFSCNGTSTTSISLRTVVGQPDHYTQLSLFPRTDTTDSEITLVDNLQKIRRAGSQDTLVAVRTTSMTNVRDEEPANMHTVTTAEAVVAIVDDDRPTSFGRGGAGNIRQLRSSQDAIANIAESLMSLQVPNQKRHYLRAVVKAAEVRSPRGV